MVDVPARDRALALGAPDTVAAELSEHFDEVTCLDRLDETALPSATFACIVAVAPDFLPGLADGDAALAQCRRLLQPDGILALSHANSRKGALMGHGAPVGARDLSRRLRSAGFASVHTFFLQPDAGNPRHIIPDAVAAMLAHERGRGLSAGVRRALARAGAGALLYTGVLVVARA